MNPICPECGVRWMHAAACPAMARYRSRQAAVKHDDAALRTDDILHGPTDPQPDNERGGRYAREAVAQPDKLLAQDFHIGTNGLATPRTARDSRRIVAPRVPPAATREQVDAEIRADRAAMRVLTKQARFTVSKHGLATPDVPASEQERALAEPEPPTNTPRGAPRRIGTIYIRGADGGLRPFPARIY